MADFCRTDYFFQKLVLFVSCKLWVPTVYDHTILPALIFLLWGLLLFFLLRFLLWFFGLQRPASQHLLLSATKVSKVIIVIIGMILIQLFVSFVCLFYTLLLTILQNLFIFLFLLFYLFNHLFQTLFTILRTRLYKLLLCRWLVEYKLYKFLILVC